MEIPYLPEKVQDYTTSGFLYIDNHDFDKSHHIYDIILQGKFESSRNVHTHSKNWFGSSLVLDHYWTLATYHIKHKAWQSEIIIRYWLWWAKQWCNGKHYKVWSHNSPLINIFVDHWSLYLLHDLIASLKRKPNK